MRLLLIFALLACSQMLFAEELPKLPAIIINGEGDGWQPIGKEDLVNVNGNADTWSFEENLIRCTGNPVGVIRTQKMYGNCELVISWRHLKAGGNSGVFIWVPEKALENLKPGALPKGIEVQVLDTAYKTNYEKGGKKADWFTTHGDVFPVGVKMKPFPPTSPNGQRSFPKQELSKPSPEWNHYYVRAINGEVRLWVNGVEVSGGNEIEPRTGYICLESEGSPIEFRNFRVRELP